MRLRNFLAVIFTAALFAVPTQVQAQSQKPLYLRIVNRATVSGENVAIGSGATEQSDGVFSYKEKYTYEGETPYTTDSSQWYIVKGDKTDGGKDWYFIYNRKYDGYALCADDNASKSRVWFEQPDERGVCNWQIVETDEPGYYNLVDYLGRALVRGGGTGDLLQRANLSRGNTQHQWKIEKFDPKGTGVGPGFLIVKTEVTDIKYDSSSSAAQVLEEKTDVVDEAVFKNPTRGEIEREFSGSEETEFTESFTFSSAVNGEIMIAVTARAGAGPFASAEATAQAKTGFEVRDENTSSRTNVKTVGWKATVKIPPQSAITAQAIVTKSKRSLPFSAKVKTTYADGRTETVDYDGTYTGVAFSKTQIELKDDSAPAAESVDEPAATSPPAESGDEPAATPLSSGDQT